MTFVAIGLTPALLDLKRRTVTALRVLVAMLGIAALGIAWYLGEAPAWFAILVSVALVIWGFDLDRRRKAKDAVTRAQTDLRNERQAAREAAKTKSRADRMSGHNSPPET